MISNMKVKSTGGTAVAEWLTYAIAFFFGLGIGLLYFAGLWWTVARIERAERPTLWLMVSFVTRAALLVTLFLLAAGGSVYRLLIAFLGFILMRVIATSLWGRPHAGEQKQEI